MKKRICSFILVLTMVFLLLPTAVFAEEATSGTCGTNVEWSYDSSTKTLTISGLGKMYDYDHEWLENVVPWYAYRQEIETVIVGDLITRIGNEAFGSGYGSYCCPNLKTVIVGKAVKEIGSYAFAGDYQLTSVSLPDTLTTIEADAFYCSGLTEITIPAEVDQIGSGAFEGCSSLGAIHVNAKNSRFLSDGGALYEIASDTDKTLVCYPAMKIDMDYTVLDGTSEIAPWAFSGNLFLCSVTLPGSLRTVQEFAFASCLNLSGVYFAEGVLTIDTSAFWECQLLEVLEMPSSVLELTSEFSMLPGWDTKNLSVYFCGARAPYFDGSIAGGRVNSKVTVYYPVEAKGWEDVQQQSNVQQKVSEGALEFATWTPNGGTSRVKAPVLSIDKTTLIANILDVATVTWHPVGNAFRYLITVLDKTRGTYIEKDHILDGDTCSYTFYSQLLGEGVYEISVCTYTADGEKSLPSNTVTLTVEANQGVSFVNKLTSGSLTYASNEEKSNIQNAIYNLLFKAQFRPDTNGIDNTDFGVYGGGTSVFKNNSSGAQVNITQKAQTAKDWKNRNGGSKLKYVNDAALGRVSFESGFYSAVGCLEYAYFASCYVYGSTGYTHQVQLTNKSIDGFIALLEQYADPGEQIRMENTHSLVFLGTGVSDSGEEGFYYVDYADNSGTDPSIRVMFYSYSSFWEEYGSCAISVYDTNNGSYSACASDGKATAGNFGDLRTSKNVSRTVIRLDCPIEAVISLDGEVLDSRTAGNGEAAAASFGTVTRVGESLIFDLDYNAAYAFSITGTGEGEMTLTLEYYTDNDILLDRRTYTDVPITDTTEIVTSDFDEYSYNCFQLFVDPGRDLEKEVWSAGPGETVYAADEPSVNNCSADFEPQYSGGTGASIGDGTDSSHPSTASTDTATGSLNSPFTDIKTSDYFYDAALWAVENHITTGTSNTTFSPNATCTRAQAVTFLWRAAGAPTPRSSAMPFADVKAGTYYYDAVLWAVENGITNGTSDTTFSPDAGCTRAQIVTFLWRASGTPEASAANPFADVADKAYYADAVLWAVENGITNGTSNTTFSPDAACTRAQIVTFLYRNSCGNM